MPRATLKVAGELDLGPCWSDIGLVICHMTAFLSRGGLRRWLGWGVVIGRESNRKLVRSISCSSISYPLRPFPPRAEEAVLSVLHLACLVSDSVQGKVLRNI